MTESEFENLTIAESSERIKSGELSPVELTDLFLQRIARLLGAAKQCQQAG